MRNRSTRGLHNVFTGKTGGQFFQDRVPIEPAPVDDSLPRRRNRRAIPSGWFVQQALLARGFSLQFCEFLFALVDLLSYRF
jgi:hypothetical protein